MKRASLLALVACLAASAAIPDAAAQALAWRNALRTIAPSPAQPGVNTLYEAFARDLVVRGGDPYLAAYIRANGDDPNTQVLAARIDAQTGFGVWANGYVGAYPDVPYALGVDASGNAFLAAGVTAPNASVAATTFRFAAADGTKNWQASVANAGGEARLEGAIVLDPSGNPVVASPQRVVKYEAVGGSILWTSNVSGVRGLALDPAGNFFAITAGSRLVKLSGATGATVWDIALAGTPRALLATPSGDAVVAIDSGSNVVVTQRGSAAGEERWSKATPPANGVARAFGLALDPAGDVIVATSVSAGTPEVRVIRLGPQPGPVIWDRGMVGVGQRLVTDPRGNPFVTGYYQPVLGAGYVQFAAKLTYSRGTLAWRYDREVPGKPTDPPPDGIALAMAPDAVYLAHAEADPVLGAVIRLAKYWNPQTNSPVAFAFPPHLDVEPNSSQLSQTIAPTGYDTPAPISVTNGEYSIGCTGSFVTSPGEIQPGDSVCVRHVAADAAATVVETTLTIGSTQGKFASRTTVVNDIFANPRFFVQQQYRDFLGREGESAGVTYYQQALVAGSMSRRSIVESFFYSPEFQDGLPQCTRLYFAFFNRIPDYGGLQFQVAQYRAGVPLETISQNFSSAPEFTSRYGSLTNEQYVDLVYQNVLGRAPDPGGRQYYLDRLGDGRLTRGQMMIGFSESTEFRDLMDNDVYVIAVYLGMLRRVPEAAGLDYYVDRIVQGMARGEIVEGFLLSPEYRSRFLP